MVCEIKYRFSKGFAHKSVQTEKEIFHFHCRYRRKTKRQRRRSRVQSASAVEHVLVPQSLTPVALPGGIETCTQGGEDVKEEPGEHILSLPATPVTGVADTASSSSCPSSAPTSFIFHKTKKVILFFTFYAVIKNVGLKGHSFFYRFVC